jgi:hypothetical protein
MLSNIGKLIRHSIWLAIELRAVQEGLVGIRCLTTNHCLAHRFLRSHSTKNCDVGRLIFNLQDIANFRFCYYLDGCRVKVNDKVLGISLIS